MPASSGRAEVSGEIARSSGVPAGCTSIAYAAGPRARSAKRPYAYSDSSEAATNAASAMPIHLSFFFMCVAAWDAAIVGARRDGGVRTAAWRTQGPAFRPTQPRNVKPA